ncbi:MAG: hypothetical protein ACLR06_17225 [Christensenellaceae bacterium]
MSRIVGVETDKKRYFCDEAIVCTGGLSYPSTGLYGRRLSVCGGLRAGGDRLKARALRDWIKRKFFKELQGLSLKNVSLRAVCGGKKLYDGFGEMLLRISEFRGRWHCLSRA